jgi:RND family efflux transporter MFP subunit
MKLELPREWTRNRKVVLPLSVVGVAIVGAVVLMMTNAPIAGRPAERMVRVVRVVPVTLRTVELQVRSQGTVEPRTESELIPEVSGRVVWTSPSLVSGGYFDAGEPLARIERIDYESGVEQAKAALARARGEDEHARETLGRQQEMLKRNVVSKAALDDAERTARVSAASVREAQVLLQKAERDLERTEISAPFSGRVRDEKIDVGQFVNRGQAFASVYATDFVEVRLPIPDRQLAYLDLPLWSRHELREEQLPRVTLSARFAGRDREWVGRIVRTEGEIDAKSRLVHVVARVPNTQEAGQSPLPVGLFVQAAIAGEAVENVAVVPRQALQDRGQVLIVDENDQLRFRSVEVLRLDQDNALISDGLRDGEQVLLSTIQAPVDGMTVRPVVESPSPVAAGDGS